MAALQPKLDALVADFKGDVGIYVRALSTGEEIAINADTVFPTASLIKVPILLKVFDSIEKGELDYHQKLVYRDSLLYPGVVLVNAPSGDYVFTVITKNQEDQSWEYDNEGFVLIREVSKILWKHVEPDSEWKANLPPSQALL